MVGGSTFSYSPMCCPKCSANLTKDTMLLRTWGIVCMGCNNTLYKKSEQPLVYNVYYPLILNSMIDRAIEILVEGWSISVALHKAGFTLPLLREDHIRFHPRIQALREYNLEQGLKVRSIKSSL